MTYYEKEPVHEKLDELPSGAIIMVHGSLYLKLKNEMDEYARLDDGVICHDTAFVNWEEDPSVIEVIRLPIESP